MSLSLIRNERNVLLEEGEEFMPIPMESEQPHEDSIEPEDRGSIHEESDEAEQAPGGKS